MFRIRHGRMLIRCRRAPMVLPSPTQLAPLRDTLATLDRCVSPMCRQERTKNSPRAGPPTTAADADAVDDRFHGTGGQRNVDEGPVQRWLRPRSESRPTDTVSRPRLPTASRKRLRHCVKCRHGYLLTGRPVVGIRPSSASRSRSPFGPVVSASAPMHGTVYATLSITITDVLLSSSSSSMKLPVSSARGVGLIVGCMPLPWCCNHRAYWSALTCCIHMCATLWHVLGKCPWQKRW